MTRVGVEVKGYGLTALADAIAAASGCGAMTPPLQVRYLHSYLSDDACAATTMVVEGPYVDRHYLAEYLGYYASSLEAPDRRTTRVHFFAARFDLASIQSGLCDPEIRQQIAGMLQSAYLGFVVVRPIPTAPIGRTVLRPYPPEDGRCFGPKPPPHRVHLFGLTLKVHGVQFQQQDMAVGACATAAVWCALASVVRRDGGRAPTPLAITQLANDHQPVGRAFPAISGLTLEQIIASVNASGYSPAVFKGGVETAERDFLIQLMIYLRSGIPVVLQVREEGAAEAHAVVAVGFRRSDGEPIFWEHGKVRLATPTVARLYVHDDRVGPYARMNWVTGTWQDDHIREGGIQLDPKGRGFDEVAKLMRVWTAVAPLYPKIRMSASDLLAVATEVLPLMRQLAGADRDAVRVEIEYASNGGYRESVWSLADVLTPERALELTSQVLFSRYVGVLRFSTGNDWLCDVVCDVTDLRRDVPPWGSVIAIVPHGEALQTVRASLPPDLSRIEVV